MKFTDGNWLMREGVRAHYPAEAYEVETTPGALTLVAPPAQSGTGVTRCKARF